MILVRDGGQTASARSTELCRELNELGFAASTIAGSERAGVIVDVAALGGPGTLLERALRTLPLDFEALPPFCEGESKSLRLWTDRVVVERFKPTVYSFTANRYGIAEGTDRIRVRFTSEVFRRMAGIDASSCLPPRSAFLAEIECGGESFLVQRLVTPCNLEVRIKRYHIGSPIHRYLYTERHPTAHAGSPLTRWTRFEKPVVCFDWRHPLHDDEGRALADEPLSDDYAAIWIDDVAAAKSLASTTFLWLETLFEDAGVRLIDMCLFIDRTGTAIYGEISPDCMRVRLGLESPGDREPLDKDLWRKGYDPSVLRDRYELLTNMIFGSTSEEVAHV